MTTLVAPSEKYKDSYLAALREYHAEERKLDEKYDEVAQNFAGYVQSLLDEEDKSKIPSDRVPSYRYWLIDEGHYAGELNIRPELNESLLQWGGNIGYTIRPSVRRKGNGKRILELGLLLAPSFGLTRVLLTCDSDNVASRKIIEHNGGQLENEVDGERNGLPARWRRYWIDVK